MGLEMALNEMYDVLYVIDILNYTVIDGNWGIGVLNCNNYDKQIA